MSIVYFVVKQFLFKVLYFFLDGELFCLIFHPVLALPCIVLSHSMLEAHMFVAYSVASQQNASGIEPVS